MIGTTLLHYRVDAKLGEGGMGEVCRTTDTKLGREVAIKVLPANFSRDAQALVRSEREAKALAALNHPHIAGIHGFEAGHGTHCLTLELVERESHEHQPLFEFAPRQLSSLCYSPRSSFDL